MRFSVRAPSLRLHHLPFAPASVLLDEHGSFCSLPLPCDADDLGDAPAWLDPYGSHFGDDEAHHVCCSPGPTAAVEGESVPLPAPSSAITTWQLC